MQTGGTPGCLGTLLEVALVTAEVVLKSEGIVKASPETFSDAYIN